MEYSEIVSQLGTTEKAQVFLDVVDAVLIEMYQGNSSIADLLGKHLPEDQANSLIEIVKKKGSMQSSDNVQQALSEIKKYILSAKTLHLTLAVSPNEELLHAIGSWVKEEFPKQAILIEFEKDPHIIGGAVIIFEGKYWDMGVGKQVDEWFKVHKSVR